MDLLDRAFTKHVLPPRTLAEQDERAVEPALPFSQAIAYESSDPLEAVWDRLANSVEQAVWQGCTVIAVTAAERGVGASTIAVGLARALDRCGHRMAVLHGSPLRAGYHEDLLELSATHDIVLVDPGPWLGPTRVRRDHLARLSQGCHAVIVVRRESACPMPSAEPAFEAVGLACLGEVLTFCEAAEPAASSP